MMKYLQCKRKSGENAANEKKDFGIKS